MSATMTLPSFNRSSSSTTFKSSTYSFSQWSSNNMSTLVNVHSSVKRLNSTSAFPITISTTPYSPASSTRLLMIAAHFGSFSKLETFTSLPFAPGYKSRKIQPSVRAE